MKYDFLIIGSGFYGATWARLATNAGFSCLILEKRNYIGGNCYTEHVEGTNIHIHKYGPHIFHTNSKWIWEFVNQYSSFVPYPGSKVMDSTGRIFSFPINLMTLHQLWPECKTPNDAISKLNRIRQESTRDPGNSMEDYLICNFGEEIYKTFFYGYSTKQWGKPPAQLPASLVKRLPFRSTYDDRYFDDQFQGIPMMGYTNLFSGMLRGISVEFNSNWKLSDLDHSLARYIVYSGAIDELFDYSYGELEYRSLDFVEKRFEMESYQGVACMHHTGINPPWTRTTEHKHYTFDNSPFTIVTFEIPKAWHAGEEPFYPVRDEGSLTKLSKYQELLQTYPNVICGGRLGSYRYLNMDQAIASASSDLTHLIQTGKIKR